MDVCIICKKEKTGAKVIDDVVIKTIRRVKQKLRIATNNVLYVCEECIPEYKKKRVGFEKTLIIYAGISVAIFLLFIVLSPRIESIIVALFMGMFILALSIFYYIPAIEEKSTDEKK